MKVAIPLLLNSCFNSAHFKSVSFSFQKYLPILINYLPLIPVTPVTPVTPLFNFSIFLYPPLLFLLFFIEFRCYGVTKLMKAIPVKGFGCNTFFIFRCYKVLQLL